MSTITHVRFFPSDWLAGTRGMTAAEMGVYITLIAMMYERAGPIDGRDLAKLARLCGTSASSLRGILDRLISDGKLTESDGFLSNRRAELEIKNVMAKSGVAREKATARWEKKPKKSTADECNSIAPAMLTSNQYPVREIDKPISLSGGRADAPQRQPDRFEDFWNAYPKRDGANPKEPARKRFVAAIKSGVEPEAIIAGAKAYAAAEAKRGNVGSPYIAQAVTWLNQRRWTDTAEQAPATGPPEAPQASGWRPGLPTDAELRAKYARLRSPESEDDDYAPVH